MRFTSVPPGSRLPRLHSSTLAAGRHAASGSAVRSPLNMASTNTPLLAVQAHAVETSAAECNRCCLGPPCHWIAKGQHLCSPHVEGAARQGRQHWARCAQALVPKAAVPDTWGSLRLAGPANSSYTSPEACQLGKGLPCRTCPHLVLQPTVHMLAAEPRAPPMADRPTRMPAEQKVHNSKQDFCEDKGGTHALRYGLPVVAGCSVHQRLCA